MKKILSVLLACLVLTGCGIRKVPETTFPETISLDVDIETTAPIAVTETTAPTEVTEVTETTGPVAAQMVSDITYQSRFDSVTEITLSDDGILVDGGEETDAVYTTHDIIYYEDRETYDSGNLYGEGEPEQRHSAAEADAHTVVNITRPGAYRVSGTLSAGQIRVYLGEDAYEDENAVVELILSDAAITCTVAPAILFLDVYECDGEWSEETAQAEIDTTNAGANLILEGTSTVCGSHVAKIFKDTEDEKKLWKQDGAIYSYMSMNVFGPGALELYGYNEGLNSELHLTINGGEIAIYSGNDGINTNEDGVSVTTINGGTVTIFAGLMDEGDGIDSNGYLVINGGTVVSAANPKSDAGLDSDLGSFINGGTVIAMGSTMNWAESDSDQVTMNLQFAQQQKAGSKITITKEDGTEIFSFDSDSDYARSFRGLILSHGAFQQGETYHVYVDGQQMAYTGNDVGRGGPGGKRFNGGRSEGFHPEQAGNRGPRPEPDGMMPPEGFEGEMPQWPEGRQDNQKAEPGEARTEFYMKDKVNAFSGVAAVS